MKFYGIQIGCNKVLKATDTEEVVAITTFSDSSFLSSLNEIIHISSLISKDPKNEKYESTLPKNDPDLSKIGSLNEMKKLPHYTYHYKIEVSKLKELKSILKSVFPRKYYIELSTNG